MIDHQIEVGNNVTFHLNVFVESKRKVSSKMKKRTRRKASEIERLRNKILRIVKKDRRISLTAMVAHYGVQMGVRNTPSDKNLVKRQLDVLAKSGDIDFGRAGRDLVARYTGPDVADASIGEEQEAAAAPAPAAIAAPAPAPVLAPAAIPAAAPSAPAVAIGSNADLAVIRAYARQVEEFSRTLQDQVATLVRMVEKASR